MDMPGFEPGAFRMQSERDTTTLHTQNNYFTYYITSWSTLQVHLTMDILIAIRISYFKSNTLIIGI